MHGRRFGPIGSPSWCFSSTWPFLPGDQVNNQVRVSRPVFLIAHSGVAHHAPCKYVAPTQQKKADVGKTLRYSTTPAYSITSPPVMLVCSSSSHPTTISIVRGPDSECTGPP